MDYDRIRRYRNQSYDLLQSAFDEMRVGRWSRAEELLWGSLTQAVKGVALSRGETLHDDEAVKNFAGALGREQHDRRIRDAFNQLASFTAAAEMLRESRSRAHRLVPALEEVTAAVERLWGLVPGDPDDEALIEDA